MKMLLMVAIGGAIGAVARQQSSQFIMRIFGGEFPIGCLLYTSPSPRDNTTSRMPSSA